MKYIKLKISKRAGFWRYKVEVELNLPSQPQASYIKGISISSHSGVIRTKVDKKYDSIILFIVDSGLYHYEDPTESNCDALNILCHPEYLTKSYQNKIGFHLNYNADINEVIDAFEDLDNEIDKMVQAPGTPAFDYSETKTKYIKFRISKKAGFWRYKVEVKLDLQFQSQAPYIKEIIIRGKGYHKIIETGVVNEGNSISLEIADSELYCCEDLTTYYYNDWHYLCPPMHLIESYQKGVEFYLGYDTNISDVVNAFKNLDNEIDKMMQALGTPAFNYSETETEYIKFRISKKAGFWRYKVEIKLDLQFQSRAPYIEKIIIESRNFYKVHKVGVSEARDLIILWIADSKLYYYEDLTKSNYVDSYVLCPSMYLVEPYQRNIEFYLKYDVDINGVVSAFKDLDNKIGKMVRKLGTPAFNYSKSETKYIKLDISKKAGFWRYKVEVELNLQPQPQASYIKGIDIREGSFYGVHKTGIGEKEGLITLWIIGSKLYRYENLMDSTYVGFYSLCPSIYLTESYQRKIKFYLKYDVNINEVVDAFKSLDEKIDKMVQASGTPAFDYSETKTKYVKFRISKKAGFWRYKVEVELDLQSQLQIPYIKVIATKGMGYFVINKTKISEEQNLITLEIADSKLYYCENLMDDSYSSAYNLYPFQKKIEFYLEHDVNINEVIGVFKNLDDVIDKKIQTLNASISN